MKMASRSRNRQGGPGEIQGAGGEMAGGSAASTGGIWTAFGRRRKWGYIELACRIRVNTKRVFHKTIFKTNR
jgi:hypothetical protein